MGRTVGSAAEETRQRILDVALRLIVERGYAGTSVRDIAEQVAMTKGSLYYHFTSKDDLLSALIIPLVEAIRAFVVEARAAGRMSDQLVARLVDVLDEHGSLLRALLGDPSIIRSLMLRHRMGELAAELHEVIGGGADPAALLRARCALGVIQHGVLAVGEPAVDAERCWESGQQPRLTEAEKSFVTRAAVAVLGVSPPD